MRKELEKLAYGVDCNDHYNREHTEKCIDQALTALTDALVERLEALKVEPAPNPEEAGFNNGIDRCITIVKGE